MTPSPTLTALIVAAALAVLPGAGSAQSSSPVPSFSAAQGAEIDARIRAYILDNPEVLIEALEVLEQRRAAARAQGDMALIATNDAALFDDGYSHAIGNPDGDVTIVEFSDYRCSYCKAAHPQVAELLKSDGRIRLILKEFPILGPDSTTAAQAAMAVGRLDPAAYGGFHDAMMAWRGTLDENTVLGIARSQGIDLDALRAAMAEPEIAGNIRATYALARALGIEGTPAFIIGNQVVRGFIQIDQMREMVDAARENAG